MKRLGSGSKLEPGSGSKWGKVLGPDPNMYNEWTYLMTVAFSGMSLSNSLRTSVSLFSWTKEKIPVISTTMISAKPISRSGGWKKREYYVIEEEKEH